MQPQINAIKIEHPPYYCSSYTPPSAATTADHVQPAASFSEFQNLPLPLFLVDGVGVERGGNRARRPCPMLAYKLVHVTVHERKGRARISNVEITHLSDLYRYIYTLFGLVAESAQSDLRSIFILSILTALLYDYFFINFFEGIKVQ